MTLVHREKGIDVHFANSGFYAYVHNRKLEADLFSVILKQIKLHLLVGEMSRTTVYIMNRDATYQSYRIQYFTLEVYESKRGPGFTQYYTLNGDPVHTLYPHSIILPQEKYYLLKQYNDALQAAKDEYYEKKRALLNEWFKEIE